MALFYRLDRHTSVRNKVAFFVYKGSMHTQISVTKWRLFCYTMDTKISVTKWYEGGEGNGGLGMHWRPDISRR